MQECKIKDCYQPIASRETGLCHKHHLRFIRTGTTKDPERVDKSKLCTEEGCDRNQQTKMGLCLKHYKQWKRKQPVAKPVLCSVCGENAVGGSKGLCVRHYNSLRRNGDARSVDENENRRFEPYGNAGLRYYKNTDGRFTHRVVAESIVGRPLRKGEVVHHVDGDKLNNSKGNIFVCDSNSHHLATHRQLEQVALKLVRDGIIGFKDGKYTSNI